jgi:hypothetical protein
MGSTSLLFWGSREYKESNPELTRWPSFSPHQMEASWWQNSYHGGIKWRCLQRHSFSAYILWISSTTWAPFTDHRPTPSSNSHKKEAIKATRMEAMMVVGMQFCWWLQEQALVGEWEQRGEAEDAMITVAGMSLHGGQAVDSATKGGADNARHFCWYGDNNNDVWDLWWQGGGGGVACIQLKEESSSSEEEFVRPAPAVATIGISKASEDKGLGSSLSNLSSSLLSNQSERRWRWQQKKQGEETRQERWLLTKGEEQQASQTRW